MYGEIDRERQTDRQTDRQLCSSLLKKETHTTTKKKGRGGGGTFDSCGFLDMTLISVSASAPPPEPFHKVPHDSHTDGEMRNLPGLSGLSRLMD